MGRFLVIGCGSIGSRHAENLQKLGQEVWLFDRDQAKLEKLSKKLNIGAYEFKSKHFPFSGWIVATPPQYHIPFANEAIGHDSHIFIEKPLSDTLVGVDKMIESAEEKGLIVQVGYQLRFHTGLRHVKRLLDEGRIGKLLSMQFEFGQYLPYWHPYEDYRNGYTAKTGITLDASHEIDMALWLCGALPIEILCQSGKLSNLEIQSEDTANILLRFDSHLCNIHLDMVNRVYTRTCKLIGTGATLMWDANRSTLLVVSQGKQEWIDYKPNDPHLDEMAGFIKCIEYGEKPLVTATEAKEVLWIALKAKGGIL